MTPDASRATPPVRSARAHVAWTVAASFAGALLAFLFILWWPARLRLAGADPRPESAIPSAENQSSLTQSLERLDQRLARIEGSLAVQESRGSREPGDLSPATNGQPESSRSGQGDIDALHKDLLQMSKRIDTLAESLRDIRKSGAQFPTLDQMRSAKAEVDWKFVEDVRRECTANPSAALARVRLMNFDDVLGKVGSPTVIRADDGVWCYFRPATDSTGQPTNRGIGLHFIRDYVTSVEAFGNE